MKKKFVIGIILVVIFLVLGIWYFYPSSSNCAKEGEQYSAVYGDYSDKCCEGLTEWDSGMDTRISVDDKCYETGLLAGNPVGTCINCGNGICEKIEDVCNCPEDCKDGKNSDYTLESFCEWWDSSSDKEMCSDTSGTLADFNFELCELCK